MLNQGTVSAWAALTSTGNATNVISPKLVPAPVTSTAKTQLSTLGVGMLRQISVAAVLSIGSFPTKSFAIAGDAAALTLPSVAGFTTGFELHAEDGTTARREWKHVATPYAVSGGTGAKYAALTEEIKAAFDNVLLPTAGTMTLEQAIALAITNQDGVAAVVNFDQTTNVLSINYGTEAQLDAYITALEALTIAADKEVVAVEFADVVVSTGGSSAVGFLE
jgi:hypothetical protein